MGVVPRLITQVRVVKISVCWLAFKPSMLWARLQNSGSLCSSSGDRKALQINHGIRGIFLSLSRSPFPSTVCLGCLNVSALWRLGWDGEFGIFLGQSAFAGRALAFSRLSSGIFHCPKEVVLQAGTLPQLHTTLCRLQKEWRPFEGGGEAKEFLACCVENSCRFALGVSSQSEASWCMFSRGGC